MKYIRYHLYSNISKNIDSNNAAYIYLSIYLLSQKKEFS